MAEDLKAAWELLSVIAVVQHRLASLRPFIWQRTKLPTAERTEISRAEVNDGTWRPRDDGDHVAIDVSVETRFKDGRFLTSHLEIIAKPNDWQVHPYIGLMDESERLVWEGPTARPTDVAALLEAVETASRNLVNATVRLDYASLGAS